MPETMTEVRERPILFSGEMIRAILDGRKTQTRRVATSINPALLESGAAPEQIAAAARCPYGRPGDRLWVREAWRCAGQHASDGYPVHFRADALYTTEEAIHRWRPSIHMPRWASRITLEITEVRVQRLMETSEADAIAEGIQVDSCGHAIRADDDVAWGSARGAFAELWDRINAPRGYGWDANPWVWALTFRRCEP